MKKLITILLLLPMVLKAQVITYYVSASTGNDSNNGTSASTPWQTLSKVQTYLNSAPCVPTTLSPYRGRLLLQMGTLINSNIFTP